MKIPELLAPAGNMDSLKAAVNAGCSCVYLGGENFSARQNADNFSIEQLRIAFDYCHMRGVNVAVTINTLYNDSEVNNVLNFVQKLYNMGVNSLIIQDIGIAELIKYNFPDIKLNASTQMTAHSLNDVRYLNEFGFERVVLSRELSIDEIKYISHHTESEIECFVHGALCVCYSGQCLMSSMIGGRSGNRGRCAQPCRMKYSINTDSIEIKNGYIMSPKDISTIEILPQLIDIGIDSFKIEGRMKRAEYVAGVVSIYRKYIDLYLENPYRYRVDKNDIKMLKQLFNRAEFSQGYFNQYSGANMMSIVSAKNTGIYLGKVKNVDSKNRCTISTVEDLSAGDGIEIWTSNENHCGCNISKQSKSGEDISVYIADKSIKIGNSVYKTNDKSIFDSLKSYFQKDTAKMDIYGVFQADIDKNMYFKVWNDRDICIENSGDIVQQALNQPTDKSKISQQLLKTGSTPFRFKSLKLNVSENIYIPIGKLNEFRRETLFKFEAELLKSFHRNSTEKLCLYKSNKTNNSKSKKRISVLVQNLNQLNIVIEFENIERIYFELDRDIVDVIDDMVKLCHQKDIELFAALSHIDRDNQNIYTLENTDIDGYLIRTWGQMYNLKNTKKLKIADYSFNTFNSFSLDYWHKSNIDTTLSVELSCSQLNSIANDRCEIVVYGYIPVMVTSQCPIGNYIANKDESKYCMCRHNKKQYFLKDRLGMKFYIMTDCYNCTSYILNSQPMFLLESMDEILKINAGSVRIQFTVETESSIKQILYSYIQKVKDCKFQDNTVNSLIAELKKSGYTKGHYFRQVE